MYHVRHRVYEPYHARWMQPDPIGFAGGRNWFEYCGGRPGDSTDPMGLADTFKQHGADGENLRAGSGPRTEAGRQLGRNANAYFTGIGNAFAGVVDVPVATYDWVVNRYAATFKKLSEGDYTGALHSHLTMTSDGVVTAYNAVVGGVANAMTTVMVWETLNEERKAQFLGEVTGAILISVLSEGLVRGTGWAGGGEAGVMFRRGRGAGHADDGPGGCRPPAGWDGSGLGHGPGTGIGHRRYALCFAEGTHHIATNKHRTFWTERFERLFDRHGMELEDPLNKLPVPGHKGPHSWEYHQLVFDRLEAASEAGVLAFYRELVRLRRDVNDPLSDMFPLVRRRGGGK